MNSTIGKRLDMIGALIFLAVAIASVVYGWVLALLGSILAIIAFLTSWFYWITIEDGMHPSGWHRAVVAFLAFFAAVLLLAEIAA